MITLSEDNINFIKSTIFTALTSFCNLANVPQPFSYEEFEALKYFAKNCNLDIKKADKGNSVVKVENDVYLRQMETILSDLIKFEKVSITKGIWIFQLTMKKVFTFI